jgi:hypothetical protein
MNDRYYWWGVICGAYALYFFFMLYLAWIDISALIK